MEKVNIKECTPKKTAKGTTMYDILAVNGTKYQSFVELPLGENDYNIQINQNFPPTLNPIKKGGFQFKDPKIEIRKASIEAAAKFSKSCEEAIRNAKEIEKYIKE